MSDVLMFHHALGLTRGLESFADDIRAAGHTVTTPDLFDGKKFPTIADGIAHAEKIGFDVIIQRGEKAAEGMGDRLIVAGFSLGALPAQKLAQTRPGVRGCILYNSAAPLSEFGESWPAEVALQIHMTEHDRWGEDDQEAAEELVTQADHAALHVYPGTGHLVCDSSFADYDAPTAARILERSLAFIAKYG